MVKLRNQGVNAHWKVNHSGTDRQDAGRRSWAKRRSNWDMSKTSLFISLCILRDLPQQKKIPRELCGGGSFHYISMFACSHGKIF
jgi:hypothetical protein